MNNNLNPWKILKEEIIAEYPIFSIKKSLRQNPLSKEEIEFILVNGLDWVNVLAFTENEELVLVRQYRHGIEEYTLELPGGCVEKHEQDAKKAAMRELLEETGYFSDDVQYLGALRPNPAMYNMRNTFFIARDCKKVGNQNLDQGEDIDIVVKPYAEILSTVKSGEFTHGMCTAAIGLYELNKKFTPSDEV